MRWHAAPDARGRVLEPDHFAAHATQSQGPVEIDPQMSPTLWIGEGIRKQIWTHRVAGMLCEVNGWNPPAGHLPIKRHEVGSRPAPAQTHILRGQVAVHQGPGHTAAYIHHLIPT